MTWDVGRKLAGASKLLKSLERSTVRQDYFFEFFVLVKQRIGVQNVVAEFVGQHANCLLVFEIHGFWQLQLFSETRVECIRLIP